MDFPIKHCDFPELCESLPEGKTGINVWHFPEILQGYYGMLYIKDAPCIFTYKTGPCWGVSCRDSYAFAPWFAHDGSKLSIFCGSFHGRNMILMGGHHPKVGF